MKSMMYALVLSLFLFASCSKDKEITGATAEQVAERFKSYFYIDGNVNANKLDGYTITEWAVCVEESGRACEVFENITEVEAPLTERYNYTYASSDGSCSMRLVGNAQADKDAVFAILYVQILGCPEFSKIYVVSREYFENKESYPEGLLVIL